jgi:hypothetical protein
VGNGTRIGLRLLGFVLLLLGLVGIVAFVVPGPSEIADWMGDSCRHTKNGPSEACSVFDVVEVLLVGPILILVGGVMVLALGPGDGQPRTLDFSGMRRGS